MSNKYLHSYYMNSPTNDQQYLFEFLVSRKRRIRDNNNGERDQQEEHDDRRSGCRCAALVRR